MSKLIIQVWCVCVCVHESLVEKTRQKVVLLLLLLSSIHTQTFKGRKVWSSTHTMVSV